MPTDREARLEAIVRDEEEYVSAVIRGDGVAAHGLAISAFRCARAALSAPTEPSGARADWWNGPHAVFRCPGCDGRSFGSREEEGELIAHCHTCGWSGSRIACFWLPPGATADPSPVTVTGRLIFTSGPIAPSGEGRESSGYDGGDGA